MERGKPEDASPEGDDVEEHFERMYERDAGFRAAWEEFESDPRHILGEQVLSRRLELGLSQTELAERLGTSRSRIYSIENGEANPRLDTLQRLADALEATVEVHPRRARR
jgi:DNA-binding XRE family transcriptional regulator